MAKFMLLLHENPAGWQQLSAEEMQKAIEKSARPGPRSRLTSAGSG